MLSTRHPRPPREHLLGPQPRPQVNGTPLTAELWDFKEATGSGALEAVGDAGCNFTSFTWVFSEANETGIIYSWILAGLFLYKGSLYI